MKQILVLSLLVISGIRLFAVTVPSDRKIPIGGSWEFIRSGLGSPWEAVRPVKPGRPESVPLWSEVTVPHCFNAWDGVDSDVDYYEGPGWYRKKIAIRRRSFCSDVPDIYSPSIWAGWYKANSGNTANIRTRKWPR